ncbi:MAG: V-type ATP synthase subunit D [Bacteroidetes bacterium GWC2_33_15]|nr:MAG: V-type ATP synthase subunit D [Bacteroidetes bacterium GWA2_33_15]OFX50882.1 MAG: V-type ATP synthase subunit D [Bacteroidetes bacterium GWC2_33_15]OFX62835.1 MAG: V-type ATP synthase subunit D [Bacteroidetes bacterium GWB2_32_14]OFX69905.1 MAG: V-type ATP synthase subunit D [Bacteroidetes bacterium GWD2_33_33]HAN18895.1 V-type ATP synthase subunit D [Bacteroidales bacterium]
MAIKFQYNKTALQQLNKQLKVRLRALPTLQSKEAALRMEVKRAKDQSEELLRKLNARMSEYEAMVGLWGEFDTNLILVKDVQMSIKKIAGVKIPIFDNVLFEIKEFSLFNKPGWFLNGIQIIESLVKISLESEFFLRKMQLLDYARKKTTQKVNLYEKVQIPGYEEAISKIKRFLEDEENLSKSSQKIVKTRQQQKEVA